MEVYLDLNKNFLKQVPSFKKYFRYPFININRRIINDKTVVYCEFRQFWHPVTGYTLKNGVFQSKLVLVILRWLNCRYKLLSIQNKDEKRTSNSIFEAKINNFGHFGTLFFFEKISKYHFYTYSVVKWRNTTYKAKKFHTWLHNLKKMIKNLDF